MAAAAAMKTTWPRCCGPAVRASGCTRMVVVTVQEKDEDPAPGQFSR